MSILVWFHMYRYFTKLFLPVFYKAVSTHLQADSTNKKDKESYYQIAV
jgi:hypothetical protein